MKKPLVVLTGMFVFMILFPTTFWVLMGGPSLIEKTVRQIFPLV